MRFRTYCQATPIDKTLSLENLKKLSPKSLKELMFMNYLIADVVMRDEKLTETCLKLEFGHDPLFSQTDLLNLVANFPTKTDRQTRPHLTLEEDTPRLTRILSQILKHRADDLETTGIFRDAADQN